MKKNIFIFLFLSFFLNNYAQKYGSSPEDSIECVKNLSIYQEFYKQKNYLDAYPAWVQVMKYCPSSSLNNFIRGNVILKNLISKETNPEKKENLITQLLELWDTRVVYFGQPGYCKGMKARDLITYYPQKKQEAYELYLEAMKNYDDKAFFPIVFYYFESVMSGVKSGSFDKEMVFDAYDKSVAILEDILKVSGGDEKVEATLANLDLAFEPFATCAELIPIYEKKFEANKTNADFLKKVTRMLDKKNCTDSDLFFNATQALHAVEPTPQSAFLMGRMSYQKKDFASAVKYLEDGAPNLERDSDKLGAYLLLANAYLSMNSYSQGRDAAYKALEVNPNEGNAYLIIGNLYAASARVCGDDPAISQRAAYWAAVDKYVKAKSVDPSVAEKADQLIGVYRSHFPSGDDLFMSGFSEGATYKVGCWINETTIIRAK